MSLKECAKCKKVFPLDDFYKQTAAKDGHDPYHIECRKAVTKKYHQENRERIAEYYRRRRQSR